MPSDDETTVPPRTPDEEALPLDPDVDVTATRLWIHPANPDQLSIEGHMIYNNMLVMMDSIRGMGRLLQRCLASVEKRDRGQTRRSRSQSGRSQNDDTDDQITILSEDEDENEEATQQGSRKQSKKLSATRRTRNTSAGVRATALALLNEQESMLSRVYKDWIEGNHKDVRRIRSKKNDHLIDTNEFFSVYLPAHEATSTEDEYVSLLQSKDESIKVELYLQLGQKLSKEEPEVAQAADRRRQFRQSSSGRRVSSGSSVRQEDNVNGNNTAATPKRKVSLAIRPGETRDPASSPTASSEVEQPRKRHRSLTYVIDDDDDDDEDVE